MKTLHKDNFFNEYENIHWITKPKLPIQYDEEGVLIIDGNHHFYFKNGVLHRDNGPAIIIRDDKEIFEDTFDTFVWFPLPKILKDVWCEIDIYHNCMRDYKNVEYWYKNGKLHNNDGPAIKCYKDANSRHKFIEKDFLIFKKFLLNKDYPIDFDYNIFEFYFNDGVLCNADITLPSVNIGFLKVWTNEKGEIHRLHHPAIQHRPFDMHPEEYSEDQVIDIFALNGKEYTKKELEDKNIKLAVKYARVWYQKCDKPGTKIWDNNIKKGWEGIEELMKIKEIKE